MTAPTWNQPICATCWNTRNPDRVPVKLREEFGQVEQCAYCGTENKSGIYVRDDPANVPYPQPKDES